MTRTSPVLAHPVWLGHARTPAFGWWHGPADRRARAGVLLCPPLGFDYLQSHPALRLLANELARQRFCVIRFDYNGMGDSAGGRAEARVSTWAATARSAIALLRQSGLVDVCVVGMRFGALFAAIAADRDLDVDQLVLWDPCATGRSFLAEERALARLSGPGGSTTFEDGALDAPGIVYDAATMADIEQMSIGQCSRPLSRRMLVLERADRPRTATLDDEAFAREGVAHLEAFDQADLMDRVAPDQELPAKAIRHIVDWLSEGARKPVRTVGVPEAGGQTVIGTDTLGNPVTETPVTVPPVGLFGVLTEPDSGHASRSTPLVMLLNAGNQHHVGPSRAWVDLSRRFAAAGIRSLRLDLSGLGDSQFRRPGESRMNCNKPDGFDDVFDAVLWGCPDDPSNVVLIGLCSSGYQALESGILLRARGVVALNPAISFVPAERQLGQPLDPRRRILLPKDEVAQTFRKDGRLGELRERWPDLAWRTRILMSPSRRSGKWLAELVRQGTNTFIICGDSEIRPIRQGLSAVGLHRLRRGGLLSLEHVPRLDHALLFAAQRRTVLGMVTDHVLLHTQRATDGPDARAMNPPPALSGVSA
jgi:pimeloyl-ACP methyl ester carboxylesterase